MTETARIKNDDTSLANAKYRFPEKIFMSRVRNRITPSLLHSVLCVVRLGGSK